MRPSRYLLQGQFQYLVWNDQVPLLDETSPPAPSRSITPNHVGGAFRSMFLKTVEMILLHHQPFTVSVQEESYLG